MTSSEQLTYTVKGMSCEHCRRAVSDEVTRVPGVENVEVDLDAARVSVLGRSVDDAAVRAAIDEAGYEVAEPPPSSAPAR